MVILQQCFKNAGAFVMFQLLPQWCLTTNDEDNREETALNLDLCVSHDRSVLQPIEMFIINPINQANTESVSLLSFPMPISTEMSTVKGC